MTVFIDKSVLDAQVRDSQAQGRATPALAKTVYDLAINCWRVHRSPLRGKTHDIAQECTLLALRLLPRLDTRSNVFALLTTAFLNQIRLLLRKERNHVKKMRRYWERGQAFGGQRVLRKKMAD